MLILRDEDVAAIIGIDDAIAAVRAAVQAVHGGQGSNLQKERSTVSGLTVHSVGGALQLPDQRRFAGVKAYASGSARGNGIMIFDENGAMVAVLEGTVLSRLRTGAATAVAVDALARRNATTVALLGAGSHAFAQVQGISRVRPLSRVTVWSRTEERARAMANRVESELCLPAVVALDSVEAAAQSDIVVTITKASDPIIKGDALRAGTHVTLAGSSHADRRESDAALFRRSFIITTSDISVARKHSGDMLAAHREGALDWENVRHIGWALKADNDIEWDRNSAITVFCSLGVGTWDVSLAVTAIGRAVEPGGFPPGPTPPQLRPMPGS